MATAPDEPTRALSTRADLRPWWAAAALLTVVLLAPALLAELASGGRITMMDLLSDPAEVSGVPWHIGAVSSLNTFVWTAAAALFLVLALGLRGAGSGLCVPLAGFGVLTAVVLVDDRFVLHEIVLPTWFGIPEAATYAFYGVALAVLVARYWRVLVRQPEALLLALAVVALGSSVALDVLGWDLAARRVAEEVAKMLGAVAWMLFAAGIAVRHLRAVAPERGTQREASHR